MIHLSHARAHKTIAAALADSDLVVFGRVSEPIATEPDADSPDLPLTTFHINIVRVLRGLNTGTTEVSLRQPGGTMNGTTYALEDGEGVSPGELGVYFLQRTRAGHYAGVYFLPGPGCRLSISSDGRIVPHGSMGLPNGVMTLSDLSALLATM